jgi:hypothetical protein
MQWRARYHALAERRKWFCAAKVLSRACLKGVVNTRKSHNANGQFVDRDRPRKIIAALNMRATKTAPKAIMSWGSILTLFVILCPSRSSTKLYLYSTCSTGLLLFQMPHAITAVMIVVMNNSHDDDDMSTSPRKDRAPIYQIGWLGAICCGRLFRRCLIPFTVWSIVIVLYICYLVCRPPNGGAAVFAISGGKNFSHWETNG